MFEGRRTHVSEYYEILKRVRGTAGINLLVLASIFIFLFLPHQVLPPRLSLSQHRSEASHQDRA